MAPSFHRPDTNGRPSPPPKKDLAWPYLALLLGWSERTPASRLTAPWQFARPIHNCLPIARRPAVPPPKMAAYRHEGKIHSLGRSETTKPSTQEAGADWHRYGKPTQAYHSS